MSSKIRVLDEHTINKIAAGEVIQNTGSVVKELVENAVDAGASDICVEITGGGRQLIRVTDNGCGMNQDDALLCLERHATSKIRQIEELQEIHTMGFRGEAVPSIASISKFSILTCGSEDETKAALVLVEGGKIIKCAPAVRSRGTTFEVKNLFYNIPVRKKFQRSPAYDASEIEKVVIVMALANPNISFKLIHNQKIILETRGKKDTEERIKELLGPEFSTGLCKVCDTKGDLCIEGYIGLPDQTRHNRASQHLFINRRAVLSPLVSFAVRDGYGTSLPANKHPIFVLYLNIPGDLVDVNVHPQKKEVRLRQEHALREFIFHAIDKALAGAGASFSAPETRFEELPVINIDHLASRTASFSTSAKSFSLPREKIFTEKEPEKMVQPQFFEENRTMTKLPRILASLPRFILAEDTESKEVKIIDTKACITRILFEKMVENNVSIDVQTLLIPETFEVSRQEGMQIQDSLDLLNKIGFQVQEIGPNSFSVFGIPEFFNGKDVKSTILEITDRENIGFPADKEREKKIALSASRACVPTRALAAGEALFLLQQLSKCKKNTHCPFGKPITTTLTQDKIEKLF